MDKKQTYYIVGAGSFDGLLQNPGPDDRIIAADGGYKYLKRCKIEPDILLGDFDSLEIVPEHEHLIRHSPIKDDTDMALAAALAVEEGANQLFLYGGLGGRLDHTLANIQLLTRLSREGIEAYLIGEGIILTAATKEMIRFQDAARGMISVFCMGEEAHGVSEKGLKYSLENASLYCDRALGVSNEFTGIESMISVKEGTILISWNASNGLPKRLSISE